LGTGVTTLGALYRNTRDRLKAAGIENAALDARLIVEHFTGTERIDVIRSPEMPVASDAEEKTSDAITRRLAHEPVHRIIGWREFSGLKLRLSRETLEPRPDTEVLVELVLPLLRNRVAAIGGARILDLGTGTGAIALALLSRIPEISAVGTDISAEAIATAVGNANLNGIGERFEGRVSNWFEDVGTRYDVILSNPPYIVSSLIETLSPEVSRFDPRRALDGGADGLDAYRVVAAGAASHLEDGGRVAVEIGHDQKDPVTDLFAHRGFRLEEEAKDLGGRDRALIFRR
jgi:release factor glutamine methyltransferase